ncbi:thioredoxin family protein [bacterium]|nr:thioredoxin family protein [bacterium]MBU1958864.1 thioredoxin family protein [bacterium]
MRKFLMLLLSLGFLSCSDNEPTEETTLSKTNNHPSINKSTNLVNNSNGVIYSNYAEAFKTAKAENKAVFILFATEYCRWCTKLKQTTLKDPKIVSRLAKEYVVLFLDRDKSTYPSKYRVKGVPAVYFTDKNEEIFTSMVGYHKDPQDYIKWFNYIQVELENTQSN